MGTPGFAAYILDRLMQAEQNLYEVIAVISQPDKAVGRKRVLTATPVKEVALKYDLPILQPAKIGDIHEELVALAPDLMITAAYGQLVPVKILEIPQYKCINVHGSLLPKYRGGAPIHYAIMNGEAQTGITIMYMEKALDAGDMLSKQAIDILDEDNLETMYDKLEVVGADLLLATLPDFFAGKITPIPQNVDEVTYAPNITREQTQIDWTNSARAIFNHVRGLYPSPATFTVFQEQVIKLFVVEIVEMATDAKPGTIIAVDSKQCLIATGDGVVALKSLQLSGKKRQEIQELMNGAGRNLFIEGECFE